jgi:acetylornithine/N-succinyldiaminopimelate aminotransferase
MSATDLTTADLVSRYVLGNYGRAPVCFTRGAGAEIWDETGRRYLDFCGGVAVCSLGHCPPVMSEALAVQGRTLIHCSNLYQIREQAELARFVVETIMETPGKVFFCNSGAEANDGLVKLARKVMYDREGPTTKRRTVITCRQSFHGRTLGGIAATGQDKVKIGFDPLLPGFVHIAFNDSEALRAAVTAETVAILIEPVQGEGGINVATPEFLATAAALRDEHGILLMYDEVQCGSGRTGDWCGWRTVLAGSGIVAEPDAVSWAKGFGGGFPIGSIWTRDEHALAMGPGTHGSTFGGSPLASAVSLAVLREIEQGGVLANVKARESQIKRAVSGWANPLLDSLRGCGLMLGFVLRGEAFTHVPGFVETKLSPSAYIVNAAREAGLLTVAAGELVVRWLPPLNVSSAEADEALAIFHQVLANAAAPGLAGPSA